MKLRIFSIATITLLSAMSSPASAGILDWLYKIQSPFETRASAPINTVGAALRGNSCAGGENVRAIVPTDNQAVLSRGQEFVVSLAKTGLSGKPAVLTITNESNFFSQEEVTLPDSEITLIRSQAQLDQLGEYDWSIRVACGQEFDVNDNVITGKVTLSEGNPDIKSSIQDGQFYDAIALSVAEHEQEETELLATILSYVEQPAIDQDSIMIVETK